MNITYDDYKTFLQNDFGTFIERAFYELNPAAKLKLGSYIELIAATLEKCRTGEITRLIISMPPRFLKSHCASIAFPAWVLGHDPSKQIISISYGQELTEKMARDTKTIMSSQWYKEIFPTRISSNRQATHDFMTTKQGSRMATSTGGVLTGRGGDILIIDDPMKPDEAMSESRRKAVLDWFDNTLLSRLNDKTNGCIIIIMQRLHQDDLVGHVLEKGDWEVLSLPAIAEEDQCFTFETPLGAHTFKRKAGEALHPERDSVETFEKERKRIGEYNFQAQYQQNPTPPGGSLIKLAWFKTYKQEDQLSQFTSIVQSWDTANKAAEFNDYSVCTTWGKSGKNYYLLNVFRKRLEYPDLKRAILEQKKLHSANFVVIEDKGSGTQLIQDLKREGMSGLKAYDPKDNDKVMRAMMQTALIESGHVYLPADAHWLPDFKKEVMTFPGSKFDDQVDSMVQALDWLHNRKPTGFFTSDRPSNTAPVMRPYRGF